MRARPAAAAVLLALTACSSSSHTSHTTTGGARPADVAKATRTVDVKASDDLRFDPPSVDAAAGETVAFRVTNTGKANHEFVVGDTAFQDAHEKEMRKMAADMVMGDEPEGFTVKPGETKTIAFTFPGATSVLYACHEVGHYAGGMKGTVTVR